MAIVSSGLKEYCRAIAKPSVNYVTYESTKRLALELKLGKHMINNSMVLYEDFAEKLLVEYYVYWETDSPINLKD